MSFQPVIPSAGLAGWRFLQRTYDSQFQAFNSSPQLLRDSEHFLEQIKSIQSAEQLVRDRRLLGIALGAFGLQDDIDNRYFVQKILEDGSLSEDSLANRLTDDRYKKLSEFFGFGPGETQTTKDPKKMAEVVSMFRTQSFEVSVGEQDDSIRIALYAQHALRELASEETSEEVKWFSLMGIPPLRSMFETALGLPKAFGQIDIDQQLEVFREKTRAITGKDTISQFGEAEAVDSLTNRFLARAQISNFDTRNSSASNALAILQSALAPL